MNFNRMWKPLLLSAMAVCLGQTGYAQNFAYPLIPSVPSGYFRPFVWVAGSYNPSSVVHGPGQTSCSSSTNVCYYWPLDIATAYALASVANGNGGAGMTVGIVDAYSNTQTESDLANFVSNVNSYYPSNTLPSCTVASGCLTFLNQTGGSTLPGCSASADECEGWWGEQDLDVQWVHAIAPNANIVVVCANSASDSDLEKAEQIAVANANVVTNSWGSAEFSGEGSTFDSIISGASVPVLFSSGDQKTGEDVDYPCTSPYSVCVGGTHLLETSASYRSSETPWGEGSGNGGAGGACSTQESQPAYQSGFATVCGTYRGAPDVALLADVYTGVVVYLGTNASGGTAGLYIIGGTSLASPMMAGVVATIDAARSAAGKSLLGNNLNALLYQAATGAAYHYRIFDIISGSNNFYSAGSGWDRASGLGDPLAPALSSYLVSLP